MSERKKCEECKHFQTRRKGYVKPVCAVVVKLHSGVDVNFTAKTMRALENRCGYNAKFFE